MKKILGSIIIIAFVLSLIGSVSPGITDKVKSLTGDKAYASTSLPSPPSVGLEKNLAEKSN